MQNIFIKKVHANWVPFQMWRSSACDMGCFELWLSLLALQIVLAGHFHSVECQDLDLVRIGRNAV